MMRRLAYDVQRDMAFYEVAVSFRNAVEGMLIVRGRHSDPDHLWWGFARNPTSGRSNGWDAGDDGPFGARVPKHPFGGSDAASVELAPPIEPEVDDLEGIAFRPSA